MRVLVVVHGHPRLSPGGGENAAYALHKQLQSLEGVTSCFLAAAEDRWLAYGSDLGSLAPDEWLMRRSVCGFFYPSAVRLDHGSDLAKAVSLYQPDVIHCHHFVHVGLDLIHAFRRWCPQARIVFTLHEFLSLCPFNGQLRRRDGRLCAGPSSLDCQQCLPERSAADLILRDQLIRSSLALVDTFISPSQYLIDQWMEWLESARIGLSPPILIDNLLPPSIFRGIEEALCRSLVSRRRESGSCVFAYFGQLIPSKGIDLLLDAWQRLVRVQPEAHLVIHGRIPFHEGEMSGFAHSLKQRLDGLRDSVTLAGIYSQEQLPALMMEADWVVMCSRWSENSPVVIQEARACARPLLVPALGGMAEKVRDGLDGLHYTPHSALALSALMRRCCEEDHLWEQVAATQAPPPGQEALLRAHLAVYRDQHQVFVDPFPVRQDKFVELIKAKARESETRDWISWKRLASLARESQSMFTHFQYLSLRSLPGGQCQIELQAPVLQPGFWQFTMSWNGELQEQRWLESTNGFVQWGWLCPNMFVEDMVEMRLHWLDWQLLHPDGCELSNASRLIWVDPRYAPSGMQPARWIELLNQVALLASHCGDRLDLAIDADPALLADLEIVWPCFRGAPRLNPKAQWLVNSTGSNWEIRQISD